MSSRATISRSLDQSSNILCPRRGITTHFGTARMCNGTNQPPLTVLYIQYRSSWPSVIINHFFATHFCSSASSCFDSLLRRVGTPSGRLRAFFIFAHKTNTQTNNGHGHNQMNKTHEQITTTEEGTFLMFLTFSTFVAFLGFRNLGPLHKFHDFFLTLSGRLLQGLIWFPRENRSPRQGNLFVLQCTAVHSRA